MVYVDGFVIKIPKKNVNWYKKMATEGRNAWMKHGALDYKECVLDDIPKGEMAGASFPKIVNAKKRI